jgi:hypothetical protein
MDETFEKVQQNSAGIEQSKVSVPSTNNSPVVEPSNSSVAKSDIGSATVTSCSNCGTTATPLWRRSPLGETICNACGLYYKARNTIRPHWLKRNIIRKTKQSNPVLAPRLSQAPLLAPAPVTTSTFIPIAKQYHQQQQQQYTQVQQQKTNPANNENTPMTSSSSTDGSAIKCMNCSTTTTPLWRRDEAGHPICNACGLYYKLHSVHRPITMKRSTIKRRKRVTAASLATHPSSIIHRSNIGVCEEEPAVVSGIKRRAEETPNTPSKRTECLRPLLPSLPPPSQSERSRCSPDPIEPGVFHHAYLPSPPMKPTKHNIACLLNPEVDRSERALPSLPSPPLIAYDMAPLSPKEKSYQSPTALFSPVGSHHVLEAHRDELKREVSNLTSLLSRTTAMLQNIDQVIGPN